MGLYAATLGLSAVLLFSIQLMFAKMVLPLLGGTPAVWNTCQVFFQAVLLLGYAYAHVLTRLRALRAQAVLHLALLGAGLLALPVRLPAGWAPPVDVNPIPALLGLLAGAVGGPFLLLSASAPLVQRWFSTTDHPRAHNPYELYVASNLGSLVGLLAYPLVVEPRWPLAAQRLAWVLGYGGLLLLMAACAWRILRSPGPPAARAPGAAPLASPAPLTPSRRLRWVMLAAIPSSLLMGVTTYLSTDIAPIPLMWVVPLSLYLITFMLTFARRPPVPHGLMVWLLPFVLLPMMLVLVVKHSSPAAFLIPLHLLLFWVICMICHGELAQDRPAPQRLTEFYLWLSFGGMLGGCFNALLAPLAFPTVLEYPLAMICACFWWPGYRTTHRHVLQHRMFDYWLPAFLCLYWAWLTEQVPPSHVEGPGLMVVYFVPVLLACFAFRDRPIRFALGITVFYLVALVSDPEWTRFLHVRRSFFGVYRVLYDYSPYGTYHTLKHGTTLHGMQSWDPARRREPLTYYHPTGPLGDIFRTFETAGPPRLRTVGLIGLGTGATTCYASPGQGWTLFEIDPLVVEVARDPRYFTSLAQCVEQPRIVLGDARLSLVAIPSQAFDLLVVDAFSSDAIPMHLITREALQLYWGKLSDHGVVAFHISNRYLKLEPVLGNLAQAEGLPGLVKADGKLTEDERDQGKTRSTWVVLARTPAALEPLAALPGWQALPKSPRIGLWTDEYSNIIRLMDWGI